jgi:hypothetical protein
MFLIMVQNRATGPPKQVNEREPSINLPPTGEMRVEVR